MLKDEDEKGLGMMKGEGDQAQGQRLLQFA